LGGRRVRRGGIGSGGVESGIGDFSTGVGGGIGRGRGRDTGRGRGSGLGSWDRGGGKGSGDGCWRRIRMRWNQLVRHFLTVHRIGREQREDCSGKEETKCHARCDERDRLPRDEGSPTKRIGASGHDSANCKPWAAGG
jgi:hypothetical protein